MAEVKRATSSTRGKKKKVKVAKVSVATEAKSGNRKPMALESEESKSEMDYEDEMDSSREDHSQNEDDADESVDESRMASSTEDRESGSDNEREMDHDSRSEGQSRHNGNGSETVAQQAPAAETAAVEVAPRPRSCDEYTLHCFFDKAANQFVATTLEFPEIKATGNNKQTVVRDLENRVESHLNLLKRQGDTIPESFQSRKYPDRLQVPISQGLFRRLDVLSRQEKISLDQLVIELLSGMIEKRLQVPNRGQQQNQPRPQNQQHHSHSHSHRDRDRDRDRGDRDRGDRDRDRDRPRDAGPNRGPGPSQNSGQGHGHRSHPPQSANNDNIGNQRFPTGPQGGQHNRSMRPRGRNYHETMDSRENFLEYVRNLEKGNWKKR